MRCFVRPLSLNTRPPSVIRGTHHPRARLLLTARVFHVGTVLMTSGQFPWATMKTAGSFYVWKLLFLLGMCPGVELLGPSHGVVQYSVFELFVA